MLDRVTKKNGFFLAPIPGSSRVAGWESSDCRRRGKVAGPECCRSRARATEAGDHSSENQGGETPDGAKDAGGRADSSEAGEGVWPEVRFAWVRLCGFTGMPGWRMCCFSQLSLGGRVTKPSCILFVSPGTGWLWCRSRSFQRIRYKAVEMFSITDPECRCICCGVLSKEHWLPSYLPLPVCIPCELGGCSYLLVPNGGLLYPFKISENCKSGKLLSMFLIMPDDSEQTTIDRGC